MLIINDNKKCLEDDNEYLVWYGFKLQLFSYFFFANTIFQFENYASVFLLFSKEIKRSIEWSEFKELAHIKTMKTAIKNK